MEESDSLYDVIFEGRNLLSLIKPLNPNLQIIPSNTSLYALDMELHYVNDKYSEIKNKVCFYLQQNWDFVLMDCPGFLNLLTINAMVASDYLMIPANADLFSLNGIDTLLNLIRDVKKSVATRLTVMGVFLTQIDEDSQISQKAQHILAENLPDLYISQYIRRDSSIAMAPIKGTDVLTYKPESTGAQDYISLVEIILSKIHNKHQVSFA